MHHVWRNQCQWCTLSKAAEWFYSNETNDFNLDDMWCQVKHLLYFRPKEWHRLATEVFRSDPIKLFSVGLFEGKGLCQLTSCDSRTERENIRHADAEIEPHLYDILMENSATWVVLYRGSHGRYLVRTFKTHMNKIRIYNILCFNQKTNSWFHLNHPIYVQCVWIA